jgi:hypothetical protein
MAFEGFVRGKVNVVISRAEEVLGWVEATL